MPTYLGRLDVGVVRCLASFQSGNFQKPSIAVPAELPQAVAVIDNASAI